jgi:hypothetical protein
MDLAGLERGQPEAVDVTVLAALEQFSAGRNKGWH